MKSACLLLALSSTAVSSSPLWAQEAASEQSVSRSEAVAALEEVIVTAQKRESALQQTPISIAAFTSDAIEAYGILNTQDLQTATPGLLVSSNLYGQLYIRGIGSDPLGIGSDPSSTFHVDGVYVARPIALMTDFYDLERIEVLRGPQGTLYGRNSTGGTINVISRRPTAQFDAHTSVEIGNYDRARAEAAISGPISGEKIRGRLAAMRVRRDGTHHTTDPDVADLDDQDAMAARAMLELLPSDGLSFLLTVEGARFRENGPLVKVTDLGVLAALGAQPVPADPFTVNTNLPQRNNRDFRSITGELSWNLGGVALKSITGYRSTKLDALLDQDGTELTWAEAIQQENGHQFSQELQFASGAQGPLEWLAGLYYFHEAANGLIQVSLPQIGLTQAYRAVGETDAYAAFGQASHVLGEKLRLTAGLRYSYEKKHHDVVVSLTGTPDIERAEPADWKAWTPKLGIEYFVVPDVMLYASVTRGFKSGGFNSTGAQEPYDPEFLWSYEVGAKSEFFDRRLRLNATAFYYDYKDLQLLTGGDIFNLAVRNAAEATVKGGELESIARITNNFDLAVNLAYLDASYDRFVTINPAHPELGLQDLAGVELPKAPPWRVSVIPQYRFALGTAGALTARAEYVYQDEFNGFTFGSPLTAQEPVTIWNGSLTWESQSERWNISLWGKNLTDRAYSLGKGELSPNGPVAHVLQFNAPPRTYGIRFNVRM